jgi:hypothetical protein
VSGRRWLTIWLVSAAIALGSCAADPYPLPVGPPHAGQASPAAVGEGIPAVVLFIRPRPGDSVEFLGAEPIGVSTGAAVEFFFSPPIILPDGSTSVGDRLLPLAGAIAAAPNMPAASAEAGQTIGIVARMTASRPGRYLLSNVRLRYRLNGGPEQTREGIDVLFTICADDPRPTDCTETAPP